MFQGMKSKAVKKTGQNRPFFGLPLGINGENEQDEN
jgi:hypothetical protein